MAIVKNVFRRKKLSDDQGDASDEDDNLGDEIGSQDAERDEGQNGETSEFLAQSDLDNPVTADDRETSPVHGLTRRHSTGKVSRKSRRTLRVDGIEDQHANEETHKIRHMKSQSPVVSLAMDSIPTEPKKDDHEEEEGEEFGFEIHVVIPAEPARDVLRRSSSRERGRRSRSSSRDAMRQVRERSRQRRTERVSKDNLDSSDGSGESIDPVSGKVASSQNCDAMASSMNSAIIHDSSKVGTNAQDGIKTSEKQSRSPRLGTRSQSSERRFVSKRERATTDRDVQADVGESDGTSQGQAVDQSNSTPTTLNRPRGSSREGRRPRREKESTERVSTSSNKKVLGTARTGLSADLGGAAKEDANQNEKSSPYRSSSRDRSKRSDSKERTRSSRADSKERSSGSRSSSKGRRGNGRSRSSEGLSLRLSKGHSQDNAVKMKRRDRNEQVSSSKDDKPPFKYEKHESSNTKGVPRRNSREGIVLLKSHDAKTQGHEVKTRTPRRSSREEVVQQHTLEGKHESTLRDEAQNGHNDTHPHKPTNPLSDDSAPTYKSKSQIRQNSKELSPLKPSQLVVEEMMQKSGSPSHGVRQQGSRETRGSRRTKIQSSGDKAKLVPNGETSLEDDSLLLTNVHEDSKAKETNASVEKFTARALPDVIIHEDLEKQKLEGRKRVGHVERCTELSPAMALLNHLGSGDIVMHSQGEHMAAFPDDDLDSQSVNIFDGIDPDEADLPQEGNERTLKADETNDESNIDSETSEKEYNGASKDMDLTIQQNVENETSTAEFDAIGHNEKLSATKAERNARREDAKIKGKKSMAMMGDQSKEVNPANDLLGFLGSNYEELFAKKEESSTPNASDPFLFSGDLPENSVDFFKAINTTGFEHPPAEDDFDRIERLVNSLDHCALGGGAKPLPPPSVAPVDEFAKQKARLARRLARQKKSAVDEEEGATSSALSPPSLAGDMPKLMQRITGQRQKKETSPLPTRGVSRSQSDNGSTLQSMLNAQVKPSKKSTSGSRPKIRRANSGDNLLGDTMCEQSLAPPSLAPPSLAPPSIAPRRMAPKTPERQEELPRKVTRREVRKATKFNSLDEDDDEEDSVGIIAPTTSPSPKKRGMLSKAQSAVNILEKTTRRVVKKATSKPNLFA